MPLIRSTNAKSPYDQNFWLFKKQWTVREGDWKLIGNPRVTSDKAPTTEDDQLFMVDLSVIVMQNLADTYPEKKGKCSRCT